MAEADARKLLNFIITSRVATMEEKQAEFAARAIDPGDQAQVMAAHDTQTEQEAAMRLFPAFYRGLLGLQAGQATGKPLLLDDSDPAQNETADALIRFLVKTHLAEVQTEELGDGHFRYQVTADWPGLQRTATLAGVDLAAALG